MSFAVPSVVWADSLDLMGSSNVAFFDHNFTNATDSSEEDNWFIDHLGYGQTRRDRFLKYYYYSLIYRSETLMNGSLSGTQTLTGSTVGTGSSTGTVSGQYNGSQIGGTSSYVSGSNDGSYDNPNSWLGDYLYYNGTYSETGSGSFNTTETGYISGSTSSGVNYSENTSGSGSYSGNSNSTGYTEYYYSFSLEDFATMDFTDMQGSKSYALKMQGFSDQLEGTAIDVANMTDSITIVQADGTKISQFVAALRPKVFVKNTLTGQFEKCNRVDGHYIAPVGFSEIAVINRFSLPAGTSPYIREIRFPTSFNVYINYDYTYNNSTNTTITNTTSQQTYDIGQQTQNQTNQLKDTTGSDGIMNAPKQIGNGIYEQVTFANQVAGITQQLATTVASADASEAGFTIPSWEFQGQQIWGDMVVSPWTNIPVDIKSKVRLFNTMIFAILWIRSLWNWLASIFGFEHVDDSGGSFDDMFDDDIPADIQARYPDAWAKYGPR